MTGLGDALLAGRIGAAQALGLARLATHPRAGERFGDVAALLLDHAEHLSFEEFRIVVDSAGVVVDAGRKRCVFAGAARRWHPCSPTVAGSARSGSPL